MGLINNDSAVNLISGQLGAFAKRDNYWDLFEIAFGKEYNQAVALRLKSQWQVGDFSQFPDVEVISNSILGEANGAYASSTNKIYLSDAYVNGATTDDLVNTLLEEYGHFVDAQINQVDSAGDEGAIFAALVVGKNLSVASLDQLKQEVDSSVVMIDGSQIAVELSEPGNTIATALDVGTISYSLTSPLAVPILKEYDDYVGGDDSDDYFKFTIDKRLGSNINLNAPTNTKLELLNAQGNLITSKTSSGTFSSTQIRENLDAGTYYLHLLTTNTTASYYSLDFLTTPLDDVSDSSSTPKDLGTLTAAPVSSGDYLFSYYPNSGTSTSFYDSDTYNPHSARNGRVK